MAVVTFGGAYAVLAYVADAAVSHFGWLAPGEMLDGLAMAETTPGPLILVLSFVGYIAAFRDPGALAPIAAGLLGGLLTAWVTFVPSFLWIFLGAPSMERLRGNRNLGGALAAITAAVVGVILNLAIWLGLHVLFRDVGVLAAGPLAGAVAGLADRRSEGLSPLRYRGFQPFPSETRGSLDARHHRGPRRRGGTRGLTRGASGSKTTRVLRVLSGPLGVFRDPREISGTLPGLPVGLVRQRTRQRRALTLTTAKG